jgi:hypothetical protein
VDLNRPEEAALHHKFTWDDTVAANLQRLSEAARIIRSVVVVDGGMPKQEQIPVRAMANVVASDDETEFEGRAYIAISKVVTSEDYKSQMLNKAKAELVQWQEKYQTYKQFFAEVFDAIDGMD